MLGISFVCQSLCQLIVQYQIASFYNVFVFSLSCNIVLVQIIHQIFFGLFYLPAIQVFLFSSLLFLIVLNRLVAHIPKFLYT